MRQGSSNPQWYKQVASLRPNSVPELLMNLPLEACWSCKHLPMYIVSLAIFIIETGLGGRNDNGWCVTSGIEYEVAQFDDVGLWNAIHVPIMLCASYV